MSLMSTVAEFDINTEVPVPGINTEIASINTVKR